MPVALPDPVAVMHVPLGEIPCKARENKLSGHAVIIGETQDRGAVFIGEIDDVAGVGGPDLVGKDGAGKREGENGGNKGLAHGKPLVARCESLARDVDSTKRGMAGNRGVPCVHPPYTPCAPPVQTKRRSEGGPAHAACGGEEVSKPLHKDLRRPFPARGERVWSGSEGVRVCQMPEGRPDDERRPSAFVPRQGDCMDRNG